MILFNTRDMEDIEIFFNFIFFVNENTFFQYSGHGDIERLINIIDLCAGLFDHLFFKK